MAKFLEILIIALMIPLFSSGEDKSVYYYESLEKSEIEDTTVLSFESISEKITISDGGKNASIGVYIIERPLAYYSWGSLKKVNNQILQEKERNKSRLFILYCSLKLHF